ncbi:MAG: hypothetical protein NT062_26020, partial [Proteobacteria bacterium]|nr:hypothetical protein [Pseudomonadota bacterium]
DLYDKTGRTEDYLRTMERLGQVAPEGEKLAVLRKLAAELEDRDAARAVLAYDKLLAIDVNADDAYRGMARVLAGESKWTELVALLTRHIAASKTNAQRIELYLESGRVYEKELAKPQQAIDSLLNVIALDEQNRSALSALPRLYTQIKAYDRAVEALVKHAALDADRGAPLLAEAGQLAAEQIKDVEVAQRHFDKALALDAENLIALRGLAKINEARGNWAQAVELLLRGEAASGNRLERVEMLWTAAQLVDQKLEDGARALELYDRILKLDPDHVAAGTRVAERLVSARRWEDALPVLEMLSRQVEGLDKKERGRREAQLGRAFEMLHRTEKAARHYKLAVEQDAENLDAAIGLADVLMIEAKANEGNESAAEQWREVDRRYREILARHRTGVSDTQTAEIWYRLGLATRALGEDKKAEACFRRALEKEALHEPTLDAMVDLGGARGEWKMVVEAKRAQSEALAKVTAASSDEAAKEETRQKRAKLLEEMGDLWRERLKDTGAAIAAYQEAGKLVEGSRVLLHKLLESFTEKREWKKAIETLDQLSAQETSPDRRARFHYTAGVIARDELADTDLAVDKFHAALDDAPTTPKAFDA